MTVKELMEILSSVDQDAIVMTASKTSAVEDADYIEDVLMLASMTGEFTTKIVMITA